jgi:hypothetical protein
MGDPLNLNPDPTAYRAAGAKPPPLIPPGLKPETTPGDSFFVTFLHSLGVSKSGAYSLKFNKVALSWLAPAPIGVVKPQRYGLPEDYLGFLFSRPDLKFTPTQVVEAALNTGPQEVFNLLQQQTRAEQYIAQRQAIINQLELSKKTDAQLNLLLQALPPSLSPLDSASIAAQAIRDEQRRRDIDRAARERLGLPNPPAANINERAAEQGVTPGVVWPELGALVNVLTGVGFIDALAAALPPDP